MRNLGFSEWRQSTVGRAENAKRRVTAGEVMWLAWALETNVAALLVPTADDGLVESPAGVVVVDGAAIAQSLGGVAGGSVTWPGGGAEPAFVAPA